MECAHCTKIAALACSGCQAALVLKGDDGVVLCTPDGKTSRETSSRLRSKGADRSDDGCSLMRRIDRGDCMGLC